MTLRQTSVAAEDSRCYLVQQIGSGYLEQNTLTMPTLLVSVPAVQCSIDPVQLTDLKKIVYILCGAV